MATTLTNGLGGIAGFGENAVARTDDGSSTRIDLTDVLPGGLNFFGQVFTGLWVNNNGSVSFAASMSSFTPTAITGSTSNPLITPFWADVDTRGGPTTPSAGGTSTGSNLAWYDLDETNGIFTATWDDVGYFNRKTNKTNAFQLQLAKVGDTGDFDITLRYENVDWTTGDFSGGSDGLGGTVARAGYSSGNGLDYLELPQSGNQEAILALESASNVGTPGTFSFAIRNGAVLSTLAVGDAQVIEGDGTSPRYVSVPVTLSAPSDEPVTVNYRTGNGSALAGQDYLEQRGTLVFAPGETQQDILIEILGDTRLEGDETFAIRLNSPTGAVLNDAAGQVTIANDDGLSVADATAVEGSSGTPGSMVFTVRLLTAASGPVTVDYATADGSASAGLDYTATSGSLSFTAGETEKFVTVSLLGDAAAEADETLSLTLSNASGAPVARSSGAGTITDDDGLSVRDVSVVEGTSSSIGFATVAISLAGPAEQDITVDYATEDGTAIGSIDYAPSSGTVTIAMGQSSATVSIPIIRDNAVESGESFGIRLSNASGAAIRDDLGIVTLIDDDGFSISDVFVAENGGSVTFTVTLASAMAATATIDYATSDGTATAGTDYTATSGTLTFNTGITSRTFTVPILNDTATESAEAFTVTLTNPSVGGIQRATATARISDDDGLSIDNVSVVEGTGGVLVATATVSRTDGAAPATVDWTTVDGTAEAGADYTAASGSLSFLTGETSKTIEIAIATDSLWEANEAFRIVLSNPSGAAIVDGSGTVTITNDDSATSPVLDILDARITEGNDGTPVMRFNVGLSYAIGTAVTVNYATQDGSALAGADYTQTSGTLTIQAGQRSGVIEVPITADTITEGVEYLRLTLADPTGGATIGDGTANGVIANDDAQLDLSVGSAMLAEGDAGTTDFTFTVTRSGDLSGLQVVRWAVRPDGTGANGASAADFAGGVLPGGVLYFGTGVTTRTITVQVAGDTAGELSEGFAVVLLAPSQGAVLGAARGTAVIGNDDIFTGGAGAETLIGGQDDDQIAGEGGNDRLRGEAGNDTIQGGEGQDTIFGGAGADSLDGGAGDADELSYAGATIGVTVNLATGLGTGGDAEGDSLSGFEAVRGGSGDDSLVGGDGADTLHGSLGDDTLEGGEGDDRLVGGAGANRLLGGGGNDFYVVQSGGDTVTEAGNAGIDTVQSSVGFTLGDHVEVLALVGAGAMDGTGNALDNRLLGGGGANSLAGLAGDDMLVGGDGADTLNGGEGADQIAGGAGADLIVYGAIADSTRTSMDVIHGFTSGEDRIDLAAIGTTLGSWAEEAFISGSSFTETGQVAWDAATGLLRIETDGTLTTAEMVIRFAQGTSLVETDLILA
jgi:Ca2+-binding RTX toxin-like protein